MIDVFKFRLVVENRYGKLYGNHQLKAFRIEGDKVHFLVNLAHDLLSNNLKEKESATKVFILLSNYAEV